MKGPVFLNLYGLRLGPWIVKADGFNKAAIAW
jgi:hypothetical protein